MSTESIFLGFSNQILQVSCVAVLAVFVTLLTKGTRPHLVHAVWLIVLLKCVTPPIVSSPLSPFSWARAAIHEPKETKELHSVAASSVQPDSGAQRSQLNDSIVSVDLGSELSSTTAFLSINDQNYAWPSFHAIADWASIIQFLLLIWLSTASIVLAVFVGRFLTFLMWVKRTRLGGRKHQGVMLRMDRLSREVATKLGMRRLVRIEVVDALIGPAIVGIFRPTILLPKVIVDKISDKNLGTLIAHELVHFRRGDLWCSALQTLSLCVYWFHPLIWIASSIMNSEAEKCCDEETIGSLKCDPVEYARCLIDVLECKHTLRAAPLLPGVRPLDITTKRLERIMRLQQGCYSRCPGWVRGILVLGALIVLPGAALAMAQQGNDEMPSKTSKESTQLPSRPGSKDNESKPAFEESNSLEDDEYRTESIDITDLLRTLQELDDGSYEKVVAGLMARAPSRSANSMLEMDMVDSRNSLQADGELTKIKEISSQLVIHGTQVFVHGTEKERRAIRAFLEHYRVLGDKCLFYEVVILNVPTKSLDSLSFLQDPEHLIESSTETSTDLLAVSFEKTSLLANPRVYRLNSTEVSSILECEGCKIVSLPKFLAHHAMTVHAYFGSEQAFVTGFSPILDDDGKPTGASHPETRIIREGLDLKLEGTGV
ncbi:M56 family metallopeptidase [Pirellulaceae bacterium SH449]